MRAVARLIGVIGQIGCVIGLSAYHSANIAVRSYPILGTSRVLWAASYIAMLLAATYLVGFPDRPRNTKQAAALATLAGLLAAIGISLVQLILGSALLPRFVIFGTVILSIPLLTATSWIYRGGRAFGTGKDRIVVIGSQPEIDQLIADLRLDQEQPAGLVAAVPLDDPALDDLDVLKNVVPPPDHFDVLVLDRHAQEHSGVITLAASLHETGKRVRSLQDFYAEWLGKLPVSELERKSLFFDIGEIHNAGYAQVKRALDIVIAFFGTIALIVMIPLVWFINLFANRGPLFFTQVRVGKGGAPFTIWKFRTMTAGSPPPSSGGHEHQWTAQDDPRVTPFGKFLRKTHLDELPQMFNILKGDLSVVGPRPEQQQYVAELSEKLPFYNLRHLVRPGLTGWAQIKYGYAGDERDALEKLQYEFFYLENQDLGFDIGIMLRTFRSMTGGEGSGR